MCDRRRGEVRAWSKQRTFGIDVSIHKLKMNNDVSNVESHEKFVRKTGEEERSGNVNHETF